MHPLSSLGPQPPVARSSIVNHVPSIKNYFFFFWFKFLPEGFFLPLGLTGSTYCLTTLFRDYTVVELTYIPFLSKVKSWAIQSLLACKSFHFADHSFLLCLPLFKLSVSSFETEKVELPKVSDL